ncbi:hypothetical protein TWF970_010643 [Orbilia oligospora]|uniref:Uncharacterized protein n=1 Tax=Orbilia oligospora TaxID=2813651 RepID=A0A7C8R4A3_ORBOL|nr:hypothetical protein TWF970_010643 [Orbilia oligospora]
MASRAVFHHAALKITPPPRTLRENREIYRSLRKFGEIDLYRSLRHETSTVEVKDDAIVLFRDEAALGNAFEASPINVSIPTVQPSPIPPSNLNTLLTPIDPPFSSKFMIEISKREHNHETRIIDQLFTGPYSTAQETPPGASTGSNSRPEIVRAPDANEYRTNLTRATGGGWKSWRLEMKQAGIPTWDSIKPTSDVINTAPAESSTARPRSNSVGWGRPYDTSDLGVQDSAQPVLPKNITSTISNPTPLPVDPTLHPFQRQRQLKAGGAHSSQLDIRNSTGWGRSATQVEGRSFHPSSGTPPLAESSNRIPQEPISFKALPQNDSGGMMVGNTLNPETPPSASSEKLTGNPGSIIETNVLSIQETKQSVKPKLGAASEFRTGPSIPQIHEIITSQQNNTAPVFIYNDSSREGLGQPRENAEASLGARINEKVMGKEVQLEQSQPNPQHGSIAAETAPTKKKWWSLPWRK